MSFAQAAPNFPTKPIRFIVPSAAGAGNDTTTRAIGQKLTQAWGQQVIVDNRAGASGLIAFDFLVNALPDGHTLLMMTASHPINTVAMPKWPYDVAKDVTAVSQATSLFYVVYAHPSVPFTSIKELIAYGRTHPGKLNYGTPGVASIQHLGWEMFSHMTGAKFTHVAYKGGAPAITATIGGEMQFGFITLLSLRPHLTAGRARALAVTSRQRVPALPDLPTVAESGLPGFEIDQWYGVVTSARVPRAVVNKLSAGIAEAVKSPDVVERLAGDGSTAVGSTAEQSARISEPRLPSGAKWSKKQG